MIDTKRQDTLITLGDVNNLIKNLIQRDSSPKFYRNYPNLFYSYFPTVNRQSVASLSDAGYLYYHSLLELDSLIDDGVFTNLPQIISLQEGAIKILTEIFGKKSVFWDYWNKRKLEYFEAVEIEKTLIKKEYVPFSTYKHLSDIKSSFGKVAIDSLFVMDECRNLEIHQQLIESHKFFSIGFQLYDDIKDFKEDIKKGQFNWAVQTLKKKIDFENYKGDIERLNKLLYIEGVGQEIMKLSISYFNKAYGVLNELHSEWKEVIKNTRKRIEGYLDVTNGYIKTLEAKVNIRNRDAKNNSFFNYTSVNNIVIQTALNFIKADSQNNYVDLKHIMFLGNHEGFENAHDIHVSDTFQRALLVDCMFITMKKYNINASIFLENECNYLLQQRNDDSVGGWSYFPTVKEVAADIDDLGQIIQLFIIANKFNYIDKYCVKAIEVAIKERSVLSGGIETWIIPRAGLTKIQEKQIFFNETKWGIGPDVEVVANFAYALCLLKSSKYTQVIDRLKEFIIKQCRKDGLWDSRWYYGDFYGTYTCLRFLKILDVNNNSVSKSLNSICNRQLSNGGFGLMVNKPSDALSTSFALLTLKLFQAGDSETIKKAEQYLMSIQNTDGSWNAVNFIKPKIDEPYRSRTLTTAFVLKALCS